MLLLYTEKTDKRESQESEEGGVVLTAIIAVHCVGITQFFRLTLEHPVAGVGSTLTK